MLQPTEEGKRRYPDNNGYYCANSDEGTPCACKEDCPKPCKGRCGCAACSEAYNDFLSCE